MAEIKQLTGITTVDEPAEAILEKAKDWGIDDVIVIGYVEETGEVIYGSNVSYTPDLLFYIEKLKLFLLAQGYNDED